LLPLFGLHELEVTAENLRQLKKTIEHRSNLARDQQALEQLNADRQRIFGSDDEKSIDAKISAHHLAFCPGSQTTDARGRLLELVETIQARALSVSSAERRYIALEAIANTDFAPSFASIRRANARLADSAQPLITEQVASDALVRRVREPCKVLPIGSMRAKSN
jgi:hypothetical protein